MTTFSVVVMEPGSDWPGQVGDDSTLVAFCQEGDELVRRTQARLTDLADHKQCVRVAVLACNDETGDLTAGRRARLARLLLGSVIHVARGRLILSASHHASHRLREHLLALAGALSEALHGSSASVSLRFEGGSSGAALAPSPCGGGGR